MLVAAGLEGRPPARSPMRTRRRSTPTRAPSTCCRPTSSRARPSTSTTCSRWPSSSRTWATPTPRPTETSTSRSRRSRATARSRATRSTSSARVIGARSSRTSATRPTSRCGKRPGEGRAAPLAEPLGRGLPGLAPRVLGDGPAPPRSAVRHPHRRRGQRLPASRGRDRPVRTRRGRAAGAPLGPRRAPADERPQDVEVGGQLPAHHGARRRGHRSARLPVPVPHGALREEAQPLGPFAGRGGCGPGLAPRRARRPGSTACRRPVGAADFAPRGHRAGPPGRARAGHRRSRIGANGRGRLQPVSHDVETHVADRAARLPLPSPSRPSVP